MLKAVICTVLYVVFLFNGVVLWGALNTNPVFWLLLPFTIGCFIALCLKAKEDWNV